MSEQSKATYKEVDGNKLKPYSRHAYNEYNEEKLKEMIESIRGIGITDTILVRPIEDDEFQYEIIAGHNRVKAAKMAGLEMITAQIKEMTDTEADIAMVESNSIRRKELLPSEKGKAYKLYLEAHKKQGTRRDLINRNMTSGQIGHKSTRAELAVLYDETETQIRRYIDLLKLIPELLDMVDKKVLALNPAVNISILSKKEQGFVFKYIKENPKKLNMSTSTKLRSAKNKDMSLFDATISGTLNPASNKNSQVRTKLLKLPSELLTKFFDSTSNDKEVLERIEKALALLSEQEGNNTVPIETNTETSNGTGNETD